MLIWCAAVAAFAGVSAQALCARRYEAQWSPAFVLLSYLLGLGGLLLRTRSLAESLTIVAIASLSLVVASAGQVEFIEDRRWKATEGANRAALKRSQRWLLARWIVLLLVCLYVDAALGGIAP